jgi:hypothetical protein
VAKLQTGGGCGLMSEIAHSLMCREVPGMCNGLVRDDKLMRVSWNE